ncbi:hypothetical protein [Parasphingorhabdus sp.]|jgi:hypothetical protein|uniref:hypothetical protein n=1 Tax=Parasphingorhabdus sp. TaxID=2709688 RepID=UPI0007F41317|nr:hypothetical protein A8B75_00650 [Sphingomonadales bacterium EhC05]
MTKTFLAITLVLALGLSNNGALAQSREQLTAGQNSSQVGLLLPAVQAVKEDRSDRSTKSIAADRNFLEVQWRKFLRLLAPPS